MSNKTNGNNEDIIIEDVDLNDDVIEEIIKEKPVSKNAHAKKLIDESRELISTVDSDVSKTKNIVSKNITALKEAKAELANSTIAHSRGLLAKVNHPYTQDYDFTPFEVEIGASFERVSVKSIGSGWFTGLILATLGMIVTALTWLFVSSKLTGEYFLLDKIPSDALFSWMGGNAQVGMAIMAITSLLVGYLIYKLKTSMKQNKNLKSANSTFEQSNIYVSSQKELKSEMIRMDEHIKVVTPLIGNYKVLLDEQNAKLERIIHIEGALENHAEYQRTSKEVMDDTEKLMESVERLISTSVTQEGKLNEFSQNALIDTKVLYESYLSKLYA